jgi:hypothetical protein
MIHIFPAALHTSVICATDFKHPTLKWKVSRLKMCKIQAVAERIKGRKEKMLNTLVYTQISSIYGLYLV